MEYTFESNEADVFTPATNGMLLDARRSDKGYNVIWRTMPTLTGPKKCKVGCYTSSGIGNNIRDAETGQYYNELVGSCDEDLFFKVCLATGECKSENNSSTLFYSSPCQYMSHMSCELGEREIAVWDSKYAARVEEIKRNKENKRPNANTSSISVW